MGQHDSYSQLQPAQYADYGVAAPYMYGRGRQQEQQYGQYYQQGGQYDQYYQQGPGGPGSSMVPYSGLGLQPLPLQRAAYPWGGEASGPPGCWARVWRAFCCGCCGPQAGPAVKNEGVELRGSGGGPGPGAGGKYYY